MSHLACSQCGFTASINELILHCPECEEPLLVVYPELESSSPKPRFESHRLLERYHEYLPFRNGPEVISLGEGSTPLVRIPRLELVLRIPTVYIKNETVNPTHSFKDRGTVAGISHALRLGITHVGAVSTGNMAVSVAAYAAFCGLSCIVIVPSSIEPNKVASIAVHHPLLAAVKGDYPSIHMETLRHAAGLGIYFINSVVPMRLEGQKTLAFELHEEIGLDHEDIILLPVSSGGNAIALLKGLDELRVVGQLRRLPRVIGVQAKGCSPIAAAYRDGKSTIQPVHHISTIAQAIANPYPQGGNLLLRLIRLHGGQIISVGDDDILMAQQLLAELAGVFVQPAGAVALAGLKVLTESARIEINGSTRCILVLTGTGLRSAQHTIASDGWDRVAKETELRFLGRVLQSFVSK